MTRPAGAVSSVERFDVVFVHGTFHGPWCFDTVASRLAERGIRATAIDLLDGSWNDDEPADLHGDAARVRRVLDAATNPVVLLGHSYGGAVITEAGTHAAVAHLLYLSGLAPDQDEFCGGYLTPTSAPPPVVHDMVTVDPQTAATLFYNDCGDETATWAAARLRPQMLTWMGQRPRDVAWRCKPSTYVICTNDQAIDPAQQREWARRCSNSVEWESGHSPFLSRPDLVVELVTEIVSAVAT